MKTGVGPIQGSGLADVFGVRGVFAFGHDHSSQAVLRVGPVRAQASSRIISVARASRHCLLGLIRPGT